MRSDMLTDCRWWIDDCWGGLKKVDNRDERACWVAVGFGKGNGKEMEMEMKDGGGKRLLCSKAGGANYMAALAV